MSESGTSNWSDGNNSGDSLLGLIDKEREEFQNHQEASEFDQSGGKTNAAPSSHSDENKREQDNSYAFTRGVPRSLSPFDFNKPPSNAPTGPRNSSAQASARRARRSSNSQVAAIRRQNLEEKTFTVGDEDSTYVIDPDTNTHRLFIGKNRIEMRIPGGAGLVGGHDFLNSVTAEDGSYWWKYVRSRYKNEPDGWRSKKSEIRKTLLGYRSQIMRRGTEHPTTSGQNRRGGKRYSRIGWSGGSRLGRRCKR
nr:hypothetical protein L204_06099 [Cryptococcus depauperatus CBS 7855]